MILAQTNQPSIQPDKNTPLPGLDAIRGLAALGVTINHLEQSRLFFDLSTLWPFVAERRLGALSVTLFFVLSGFLITHLLLIEFKSTGRISLRDFYVRRMLRIWPLYYLLTFFSFFVIPFLAILKIPGAPADISDFAQKLSLYLALSPHLAQSFYNSVPYGAVLWSVGVEEWFYLFWPLVLFLPLRFKIAIISLLIFGLLVCRWQFREGVLFYLFSQIRFDCMAIGAAGALAWNCRKSSLVKTTFNLILSRYTWIATLLALCLSFGLGIRYGIFDDSVYSLIFLLLILNASIKNRGAAILSARWLRYCGKISYGVYCFNWIALVLALALIRNLFSGLSTSEAHFLHYLFGFALTFGIAAFSYHYFESPFLKLKENSFSPLRRISPKSKKETFSGR